jgi:NAD(P)-dependent dehydrogenase (short-subunit alcohol dehydrogenase family)
MPSHPFDLTGRVALITGAGRGIGVAVSAALAEAGAAVALASRTQGELDALAGRLRADGHTVSTHRLDVTDRVDVGRVVAQALATHGRIDILINNAGTNVQQAVLDITDEAWDLVLNTNVRGTLLCSQAVAPHMLERGSGKIVNVASTFAALGYPGRGAYAASKGAVVQLTKVMALEWAAKGLNVNAVGPTATRTPMNEELFTDDDYRERVLARIPAGRWAEPEDTAAAVLYLASSAADMVNGHLLLVDGGWSAI